MTQQKRQTTTSKRTASPHVDSPSGAGTKEEPPKKRGRTTRRSLAVQAEEDAIAAAKDRREEQEEEKGEEQDEERDEEGDEEEDRGESEGLMDEKGEEIDGGSKKKGKKEKENEKEEEGAAEDDTAPKVKEEEPQVDNTKSTTTMEEDDNSAIKKEEDTEDKKHPILEIPQHMLVEKGHVYFFYRPKMDVDQPSGPDDVQKLYMLLSPDDAVGRVSTASADSKHDELTSSTEKSDDDSGNGGEKVKKETETEDGGALHRLLILPRKALPVHEPAPTGGDNSRGNRPGARNWAFVDTASRDLAAVESRLKEYTYTTKTRGDRIQAAARFIAQARYEIILDHVDPEHPQRQSSHFVYELEVPTTPGPVQKAFKISKEGQFLIQVKNPRIQTPATAKGAVRYATLKDKAAQLPKHLQEKFKGVRKDEVRYAPMDSGAFLDLVHLELVFLAVKRGAREDFEGLLKELEEEVEEEMAGRSDSEGEGESGAVEHVYKELEVDEKTIPAAVDEFK
ncbi:hypothetical protein BG015_011872 [Linnemannia schmuckeri]|uniref:Uncharacterized protein n=1 Tax=Linnemannia schmuckeri TaxID=64567 RepID=A0A9P5V7W1_9FUNG|nr:hypothetical protein BG015_011872 [Linnemannia schmuckeri]